MRPCGARHGKQTAAQLCRAALRTITHHRAHAQRMRPRVDQPWPWPSLPRPLAHTLEARLGMQAGGGGTVQQP